MKIEPQRDSDALTAAPRGDHATSVATHDDEKEQSPERTGPPSPRELRDTIPADSRRQSTAKALVLFLAWGTLYLATLAAIIAVPHWPFKVLLAAANATLISVLFVIGHDACHGALTASRRLNAILGRMAFLPSWHPYSSWDHGHNHVHHSWTNLRSKDYVWAPRTKAEYDSLSPFGRWLERFYRSPWGFGAYYLIEMYWKRLVVPSREFWGRSSKTRLYLDCLLVLAFMVLQAAFLVWLARWLAAPMSTLAVLVLGQWLPFLLWNWLIGFVTFLHHIHPRVPWFDKREQWSFYAGHIQGTVHTVYPWGFNFLSQHIMEHTAHHVDPRIPLYNLSVAQRSLEVAYPDDVAVQYFTLKGLRQTVRVCQLYDFERHRWLSYSGEPTSGPTIWPLPG